MRSTLGRFCVLLVALCGCSDIADSDNTSIKKTQSVDQPFTISMALQDRAYRLSGEPALLSVFENGSTGAIARVELEFQAQGGDASLGVLLSPLSAPSDDIAFTSEIKLVGDSQVVGNIGGREFQSVNGHVALKREGSRLSGTVRAGLRGEDGATVDAFAEFSGPITINCFAAGPGQGLVDEEGVQDTWHLDTVYESPFCRRLAR